MNHIIQQFCLGPLGMYLLIGFLAGTMFALGYRIFVGTEDNKTIGRFVFLFNLLLWPFSIALFLFLIFRSRKENNHEKEN